MKKVIFTAATLLALSFANAQEKSGDSDVKFGLKAGYVNANYGSDANHGDARSGFYFGGLVDFAVSEKFHVQPEILYTMEGSGEEESDLNFVRIPIMAKYYVIEVEGLSLQAGPEIAFVAGGGMIKDFTKSTDFALGFGAGYELSSGLFFDARYNLGLTDLNDFPSGSGLEAFKVTQNSFNLGLGVRF